MTRAGATSPALVFNSRGMTPLHAILAPMKRHITPILSSLLLLIALAFSSSAQDVTDLQWLEVRLWPEYDTPDLLVILVGEPTQPNQPLLIPLPPGARVHAVASSSTGGSLVENAWELITTAEGVNLVSMTPDGQQFQIEFYAPIAADSDKRDIDYELPAGYVTADNATVEIVIPPSASEVAFDPEAAPTGDSGSQDHVLLREVGPVSASESVEQRISYNNASGEFTFSAPPASAAPITNNIPTTSPAADTSSNRDLILVGLAGLAVILIAAGAFVLWRSKRSDAEDVESPSQAPVRKKRDKAGRKQNGETGQDRFCRKCGAAFSSSDRFCRKCGEKRL